MLAVPICFRLFMHADARAFSRAWAKTGKRMAASIAMIAMTTKSSMRVNPRLLGSISFFSFLRDDKRLTPYRMMKLSARRRRGGGGAGRLVLGLQGLLLRRLVVAGRRGAGCPRRAGSRSR